MNNEENKEVKEVTKVKKATPKKEATEKVVETPKKVKTLKPLKEAEPKVVEDIVAPAVALEEATKEVVADELPLETTLEEQVEVASEVTVTEDSQAAEVITPVDGNNQPIHDFVPLDSSMTLEVGDQLVEESRIAVYSVFKRFKLISSIMMAVVLVFLVGGLFFMSKLGQAGTWILLGGMVAFLLITFIVKKKGTAKINVLLDSHLKNFYHVLDSAVYGSIHELNSMVGDNQATIEPEAYDNAMLQLVTGHQGSRDLVKGQLGKHEFQVCDMAYKIPSEANPKKTVPVFFGKFMNVNKSLNGGRVVILGYDPENGGADFKTREGVSLIPIDGLKSGIEVYATDEKLANRVVTKDLVLLLNQLAFTPNLLDFFVSYNSNTLSLGLSYSDFIMSAPIMKSVNLMDYQEYVDNAALAVKILDLIK